MLRLALLLFTACEASIFRQPDISLCKGDCSSQSDCSSVSSGDSCSAVFPGLYASASCSDLGALSLKFCSGSGCSSSSCTTTSSSGGGCEPIHVPYFEPISARASCALTPLAVGAIVMSALLLLLCCSCYCCCGGGFCTGVSENRSEAAALRLEESAPLVTRREIELRGRLLESNRRLVEIKQRMDAISSRQARESLLGGGRTARRAEAAARHPAPPPSNADIPVFPASATEPDEDPTATPHFQASGADVSYWPRPLTKSSFMRSFESTVGRE